MLTNFRYIRTIWRKNAEEERLLGVSLTGIMDHPVLNHVNDEAVSWLKKMKEVCIETNNEWADKLGIERSVALTTVKPSGCQGLDNKIRTADGEKSIREIFEMVGWTEEMMNGKERQWLKPGSPLNQKEWWYMTDLSKLPKVFDRDDRDQEITGIFINGVEPVYEIEFEDGNIYKFTGNHKLMTSDGWMEVSEIDTKINSGIEIEILTEPEYYERTCFKKIVNGNWDIPKTNPKLLE